jgi:hypothetical protein
MADTDHDKTLAALEQLEAERRRRLQDKIDTGEVVSVQTTVIVENDDEIETATARALARNPAPDDGRPVHREFLYIFTGVPRGEHLPGQAPPQTTASSERAAHPDEKAAGSGEVLSPSPPSQPVYVKVTIRNGDDEDPGEIAEGWYTVENGLLELRDRDDKFITSRARF